MSACAASTAHTSDSPPWKPETAAKTSTRLQVERTTASRTYDWATRWASIRDRSSEGAARRSSRETGVVR
jgi:hypothetical protein